MSLQKFRMTSLFYGFIMAVLKCISNFLKRISSVFTNGFNALLACHIPACKFDFHKTMNISKICNHMTLVHLVRITTTSVLAQLTLCLTHPAPSLAQSKLTTTLLAHGKKRVTGSLNNPPTHPHIQHYIQITQVTKFKGCLRFIWHFKEVSSEFQGSFKVFTESFKGL